MCPATGSSCGPRLAGGDGLARELTREEKKKIRALVVKWCANYDKEYGCLPLECECYMFGRAQAGFQGLPGLRRACSPGSAAGVLLGGLCKESPPPPAEGIYAEKAGLGC